MDNSNQTIDTTKPVMQEPVQLQDRGKFDLWEDRAKRTPHNRITARHDAIKARVSAFTGKFKRIYIFVSLKFMFLSLILRWTIYGCVIYLMFK